MNPTAKPVANIYIVNHDFVHTSSLKKAIKKPIKYNIETFSNGEKFIAHLASLTFTRRDIHIVFLGYQFIDEHEQTLMNGIEVLEAVKTINPDIEVIMLYDRDEATYGAYARNRGAFAFVPKGDTIFLRVNNIIMRVITQKKLRQKRRNFVVAIKIFIAYIILLVLAILLYQFLL
ncbi:MAG: response regulator [Bacteroidales bacterium]|nr:response regulator [Bacteroidales bacterium]MDD4672654.1 response regulator [Bacteroidales bacterium]MDY0347989.1 response regulator [Tenuifilaceae bacterium]